MKFKKLYLLWMLFMTSTGVFAQNFELDWKGFVAPNNWKLTMGNNPGYHLNKKIVARLVFKNQLDDQLEVGYEIFNDFEVDSLFKAKVNRGNMLLSCLPNTIFLAFNYKGYYYLPFACNSCLTNRIGGNTVSIKNEKGKLMTNCEYLNYTILKFVASKP